MNTILKGTLADYLKQNIDMEKLISILKQIDDEEISVMTIGNVIKGMRGDNIDLILIESLADELLITEQGQCNWPNIRRLKNEGYNIYAGDKDDFGWLTGCIETKKGIIVYG